MSCISLVYNQKSFLSCRQIIQISKAFLNARRKANITRYCLEPRRRISAIFENPNSHNALRNGPDYSFLDNRPTPYGVHQYKRICQSIEHTEKIIQYNKEIELAFDLEREKNYKLEADKKDILDKKLNPKGGTVQAKLNKVKGV